MVDLEIGDVDGGVQAGDPQRALIEVGDPIAVEPDGGSIGCAVDGGDGRLEVALQVPDIERGSVARG